jgi:hypothetical protein
MSTKKKGAKQLTATAPPSVPVTLPATTAGAKQIFLTTQQMAFLIFNLFGHDIIHDAHPALTSGSDRFLKVLSKSSKETLETISTPTLVGGGGDENNNDNDDYFGVSEILAVDESKRIAEKSVETIVTSIGELLVERKMVYAVEYKKIDKEKLTFKNFQEKTFIIIDVNRIATNFNNKDRDLKTKTIVDPTYPGDIFYKGQKIPFWKITVTKVKTISDQFNIEWTDKGINYTVSFQNQQTLDVYPILTISENNKSLISFFVLCSNEETTQKKSVCGSIDNYIKSLGHDFFYDTFVSFMKNETYFTIDGLYSLFPEFIGYEKLNNYQKLFNVFIESINKISYSNEIKAAKELFTAYNIFYNSFLDLFKVFYDNAFNVMTRLKRLYPTWDNPDDVKKLVENVDAEIQEDKTKDIQKKYIIVIAKIFAAYFNTEFKKGNSEIISIYNNKILVILQNNTCDTNLMYVKNFFKTSSLYFESDIIEPPVIKGGYKQSGGAQILDIMSTNQKDSFEDKSKTPELKYTSIMTGVDPYEGKINKTEIDLYLNLMKTSFNYSNVLDLILIDLNKTITKTDLEISTEISNASTGWVQLFNMADFPGTHKYLKNLNDLISPATANLNSITKMPATGNVDIKPIFKINCETIAEIDKTVTFKLFLDATKNVLIELYNFEQAFIVQLKVFLLYNYVKLYAQKGNPPPNIDDTKKNSFWTNLKKNYEKYYSIIKLIIASKIDSFSQVQKVNSGYMVSSSIGVISYCIKKVSAADINRGKDTALDNEMEILESIYLTKNLQKGSSVGDPDDKLIKHFKKIISAGTLSFAEKSNYTISNSNSIKNSKAKIMDSINLPSIPNKNLYLINNAINSEGISDFFCPFSSILDGQPTCSSYDSAMNNGNPIEDGELNVLVRDGLGTPETMRYHVRVKKSTNSGNWTPNKKIVEISAYLKIKDKILINIGWEDEPTYQHKDSTGAKDPIIGVDKILEVDLTGSEKSPFDAKLCISNIIDNNIKLLTNSDGTLKKWNDFLNIINNDGNVVSTQYGDISRDLFRRKIIQTSFIKSLGDYLQEINTVAENGGYIGTITSTSANGNSVLLPPNTFRLGLSNDRPSGVRIAALLLFGLYGINPNAMGGYYTIAPTKTGYNGSFVIASRDKSLLKNSGQTLTGGSINKKITKKSRKQNLTKKQKKLLKNRKISKRNNKGTIKRK